ncbi:O-antigen ligase family protein [uncultured Curtobacterium sp.]|uniref:O-antigen ligase family protein n=1 Tax=uncultured Curtobacterium sp. TaxID=331964 RepID=UPI00258F2D4F|nr:O-antigen ligase family protein [uncultured Curtobacterium sp.]
MNPFGVVLAALVGIYFALFILTKPSRLAILLVAGMFVTRLNVDLGGLNFRPETLAGVLAGVALLSPKRTGRSLPVSTVVSIGAVLLWLLLGAMSSVIGSPELSKSLSVLIWCLLSVVSAVWIARNPEQWKRMIRVGAVIALICSALAVLFWAAASAGLSTVGVQVDPTYGGYASYVASIEANVLAGLLCLWGIVAAWNPLGAINRGVQKCLVVAAPIAILTTHTRAALVALILGLCVVFVCRRSARGLVLGAGFIGGVASMSLLFAGSDSGFAKFGNLFDTSGGTGGLRLQLNTLAFDEWRRSDSTLLGLGWNSFGQRHVDPTRPFLNLPAYIGNLPLQLVYDGGLLALATVALAASIVVVILVTRKRGGLVLALAVPYLLFSLSTSVLWLFETWFWVGLAWGLMAEGRTTEDMPARDIPGLSEARV